MIADLFNPDGILGRLFHPQSQQGGGPQSGGLLGMLSHILQPRPQQPAQPSNPMPQPHLPTSPMFGNQPQGQPGQGPAPFSFPWMQRQ